MLGLSKGSPAGLRATAAQGAPAREVVFFFSTPVRVSRVEFHFSDDMGSGLPHGHMCQPCGLC